MNDMSRPQTASRLSEDIGDVLSAIRRLIAEDDALDYARETLRKQHPVIEDPADRLASRFGGASAMARQMVRDGIAARDRRDAEGYGPVFTERSHISARPRLVADHLVPPSRGDHADLVARRDLPPLRRPFGLAAEDRSLAPLRLGDADRVTSALRDETGLDELLDAIGLRDAAGLDAAPRAEIPTPVFTLDAVDELDDDDIDFAEAFDAKARMRPDIVDADPIGAVALSSEREQHDAPVSVVVAQEDAAEDDAEVAASFWVAYTRIGEDEFADEELIDGEVIVDEASPAEALEAEAEATEESVADASVAEVIAFSAGDLVEAAIAEDLTEQEELVEQEDLVEQYELAELAEQDDLVEATPVAMTIPLCLNDLPETPDDEIATLEAPLVHEPALEPILAATVEEIAQPALVAEAAVQQAVSLDAVLAPVEPELSGSGEVVAVAGTTDLSASEDAGIDAAMAADEATVREVIREIIQEELHGELGQRFSRNLRAVIRREVAAAIDDHLERI